MGLKDKIVSLSPITSSKGNLGLSDGPYGPKKMSLKKYIDYTYK